MTEITNYRSDVDAIKRAILESQARAARATNEEMLRLYYAIGGFVSFNTREGRWKKGATELIGEQLQRELPGLRGFSGRNLRYMRAFFEEWTCQDGGDDNKAGVLELANSETLQKPLWNLRVPNLDDDVCQAFFSIGFTHHRVILGSVKDLDGRLFYIKQAAERHLSVEGLKRAIRADEFHHTGTLANNFEQTIPTAERSLRAVNAFKDEYLLDFINVEQLGARDKDIDERMLENGIVAHVKDFIMTFGRDFTFVGNQYHVEAFGEDQYIDLLFFNRGLNCLVAIELKSGPFKTAYLGQLSGYLSVLDEFVRKPHEEPSLGIVLCKDVNRAFVDFVIRDYEKPLGVATYKTSQDMPTRLREALPASEDLRALLEREAEDE